MPAIFFRGTNYSAVSSGALEKILEESLNTKSIKQFTGFSENIITPKVTKYKGFDISSITSSYPTPSFLNVINYKGQIHLIGLRYMTSNTGPAYKSAHYTLTLDESGNFNLGKLDVEPPVNFKVGDTISVVHNNEIHLFCGENNLTHLSFDGSSWSNLGNISSSAPIESAVSCKGNLYALLKDGSLILVNSDNSTLEIASFSDTNQSSKMVSLNDSMYVIGGKKKDIDSTIYSEYVYKIGVKEENGYSLYVKKMESLPFPILTEGVIAYNNEIHVIGYYPSGDSPSLSCYHLKYKEDLGWYEVKNYEFELSGRLFNLSGKLLYMEFSTSADTMYTYEIPQENVVEVSAYLPKNSVVSFNNLEAGELKEVTNATKQEDGISFKVLEDGIVTAKVESSKELKYTII